MALITNHSDRRIAVTGKRVPSRPAESFGLSPRLDKDGKVDPASSREIDDAVARFWAGKAAAGRMIQQGTVTVAFKDGIKTDVDVDVDVESVDDVDVLEKLYSRDDLTPELRARVEARFESLAQ